MNPKPAALLFDLGRVLLDIEMSRIHRRWAVLAGVDEAVLLRRSNTAFPGGLFKSAAFQAHERGEIGNADFFAVVRHTLQIELTDVQLLDGWNSIFLGEMPDIRDVLTRVRGRLPLYIFSNTNAAHYSYWSAAYADLLVPFEAIFTSNHLGARKPESAAFAAVVTRIGQPAARILFLDDVMENVAGARACGLRAEHVATSADIESVLGIYGL